MAPGLVSRRTALKLTAAASVVADELAQAKTRPQHGYGADPDLLKRPVTWPTTLESLQLATLEALCAIVLPSDPPHPSAASIGVHRFLNEWLSAPYPQMRADRTLILEGLAALDDFMRQRNRIAFKDAAVSEQAEVFDNFCADETTASFSRRIIELICSGYYTTREGHAAIGYTGNVALASFPEPLPEVVRRFEQALSELMLTV